MVESGSKFSIIVFTKWVYLILSYRKWVSFEAEEDCLFPAGQHILQTLFCQRKGDQLHGMFGCSPENFRAFFTGGQFTADISCSKVDVYNILFDIFADPHKTGDFDLHA